MMLVDFGGVPIDVEGMSKAERDDLNAVHVVMSEIVARDGRVRREGIKSFVLAVLAGIFLSFQVESGWQTVLVVSMIASFVIGVCVTIFFDHINRIVTANDVYYLRSYLYDKKKTPCVALIHARMRREPILAKALKEAVAQVDLSIASAAPD